MKESQKKQVTISPPAESSIEPTAPLSPTSPSAFSQKLKNGLKKGLWATKADATSTSTAAPQPSSSSPTISKKTLSRAKSFHMNSGTVIAGELSLKKSGGQQLNLKPPQGLSSSTGALPSPKQRSQSFARPGKTALEIRSSSMDSLRTFSRPVDAAFMYTRLKDISLGACRPEDIKVLVVGSEKFTSQLTAKLLQKLGYQVTIMENGVAALGELASSKPENGKSIYSLVFYYLLDSEVHGFDFLEKVKDLNVFSGPHLPVIILSSGGGSDTAATALRKGAIDFLQSPVTVELLKSRLYFYLEYLTMREGVVQLSNEVEQEALKINPVNDLRIKELEEKVEELKKENAQLKLQVVIEQHTRRETQKKQDEMKKKVCEAFTTPLQIISKTVSSMSKSKNMDASELKRAMLLILSSLSSNDLYSPKIEKIVSTNLNDRWSSSEQEMAKRWIVAHFTKKTLHPRGMSPAPPRKSTVTSAILTSSKGRMLGIDDEDYEKGLAIVQSWECYVWAYTREELLLLITVMFKDLKLFDEFNIPLDKFNNFVRTLSNKYNNNPYHNFQHAFDVTNMMYLFLKNTNATTFLTSVDIFALMIASLSHDVGHPGLNNAFQITCRSELAVLYNDQSVLENFHSATAWKILSLSDHNIICNMSPEDEKEFRRTTISSILTTDMSVHFELMTKLSSHLDNVGPEFDASKRELRTLLCDILLHSADISNLVRPHEISKRWSDCLFEEMLAQGDVEKARGIPVSPYMDRDDSDQVKLTLNFVDFIVLPLYKKLAKAFPPLEVCVENIQKNRNYWAEPKAPKKEVPERIDLKPNVVNVSFDENTPPKPPSTLPKIQITKKQHPNVQITV